MKTVAPDIDDEPAEISEEDELRMLRPGTPIKFTGGRYNGFTGSIRFIGDTCASIVILYDNKPTEVVEDLVHLTALQSLPRL